MTLQDVIKEYVTTRYYANNCNMTATALELGVCVRSMRKWINKDRWPYEHSKQKKDPSRSSI